MTINKNKPRNPSLKAIKIFDDDLDESYKKIPLLQKSGNPSHHHQEFNGASFAGAVFNLSTTIIGAGIMALPATMKVLGLILGISLIVFVAMLTEFSIRTLLRYSKAGGSISYGETMGDAFGNVGRKVLQACVVINNVGVLVVYMIIIGDVLSGTTNSKGFHHAGLLEEWFGQHWWNRRFFVLFATTLIVVTPLACFKRIDSLRHTSTLAVFLAFVFIAITTSVASFKWSEGTAAIPRLFPEITDINSVWRLFTVVPVLVTAYVCHFNVHSIENELEDRSKIEPIVRTSIALCSIIYIMTSFFGFLLFGDSTLDDILSNFDDDITGVPWGPQLSHAVRVSYALHLMLVFPVIFFPLRLNLDGLFFPRSNSVALADDNVRFFSSTTLLISVVFLGANFVPSIWDAFQFTGATSAVCIGYVFPSAIALRDRHGRGSKKDKILAIFMVGLAVFASLVAIYSDAYAVIKRHLSPSE